MIAKLKSFFTNSWPYLIFIAISMLFLPTSLIYQTSPIGDINTMLAMGNSLAHGVIPFVDLFEQRGPYMYVIHMVAALPGNGLHWIYLIELINFYITYRIFMKIAELKVETKKARWYAVGLLSLFMISPTTWYGASPEEFCIVPVVFTIYLILKYLSTKEFNYEIPLKYSYVLGVSLGYITLIKYSIIGTTVGFFIGYGLLLLFQKKIKLFLKTVLIAISGLITGLLPAIIFYASIGKLGSASYQYFIANTGLQARSLSNIITHMIKLIGLNWWSIIAIILGLIWVIFTLQFLIRQATKPFKFVLLSTVVFQTLTMVMILRLLPTYMTPGLAIILSLSVWACPETIQSIKNIKQQSTKILMFLIPVLPIIALTFLQNGKCLHLDTLFIHNKVYNIKYDSSFQQGKFIKANGGGNIITLYDVARAVYAGANSYPTLKYFDQTTISYKSNNQSGDAQIKYIDKKQATWVQTPMQGFEGKLNKHDTLYIKKAIKNYRNEKNTSQNELGASIDTNIQRPKKYPNQYYNIGKIKYKNSTIYMPDAPKALMKNYKIVSVDKIQDGQMTITNKNHQKMHFANYYILFTTKENAQKHHLKTIPFIIED